MSTTPLTKWTVFWAVGPVDDPTDGQTEVEADTIVSAHSTFIIRMCYGQGRAELAGRTPSITAIIRTDCLGDFT